MLPKNVFGDKAGEGEVQGVLESYGGGRGKQGLAEGVTVLELEKLGKAATLGGMAGVSEKVAVEVEKRVEVAAGKDVEMAEAGGSAATEAPVPAPQVVENVPISPPKVQRTKDGKKRIAPTFIRA